MFFARLLFYIHRRVSALALYRRIAARSLTADLLFAYLFNLHTDKRIFNARAVVDILRLNGNFTRHQITSTGTVLMFAQNKVFHFPGGPTSANALQRSHTNHGTYILGPLKPFLDYMFQTEEIAGQKTYVTDLLQESDDAAKQTIADQLFQRQKENPIGVDFTKPHLDEMVQYLSPDFQGLPLFKQTVDILTDTDFAIVHGDLHSDNIMSDASGNPCLIDLDRMCSFDPAVDQINFAIIPLQNTLNKSWLDILAAHLSDTENTYPALTPFSRDSLLRFIFFRLYFEMKINTGPMRDYLMGRYKDFYMTCRISD